MVPLLLDTVIVTCMNTGQVVGNFAKAGEIEADCSTFPAWVHYLDQHQLTMCIDETVKQSTHWVQFKSNAMAEHVLWLVLLNVP